MDVTKRFTGKADFYSKFRPGYPEDFILYLIHENHLSVDKVIADIGSGTGKLSVQLLEKGLRVIGVEPNDDMRLVAEESLKSFSTFTSQKGSAEHTGLDSESVDLITVAQAFHWFDAEKFKEECKRILKPDGKVALVWNSREMSNDLIKENASICEQYCLGFKGFSGGFVESPEIFKRFFDGAYQQKTFSNDICYDLDGFIGRNLSSSYAPLKSDSNYNPFVEMLIDLFDKHSQQGMVTIPNVTHSYLGQV